MNRAHCIWMLAGLAAVAACNRGNDVPLAAAPDEYDFTPAKSAIARLKELPNAVQQVVAVVRSTNFGPFDVSGSCDYQCFIGICLKTFSWAWHFPNYTWLKSRLEGDYSQVEVTAAQFDGAFLPVKSWLTNMLPQVSQQIDASVARATAPDATAASILQAVDDIRNTLQQGADQLQTGTQGLSAYNQRLTAALHQIDAERAGMEQMFQNDDAKLNQTVGDYPCGDDDARNAARGVHDTVKGQYEAVASAASNAGVLATQSDEAVSIILGTIINLRTRYQGVFDQLDAAKITPAEAVQQLKLSVASQAFHDLAAYARQQLE